MYGVRDRGRHRYELKHILFQIMQDRVKSTRFLRLFTALQKNWDGLFVIAGCVIVVEKIYHCNGGVKSVLEADVSEGEVNFSNLIFRLLVQAPAVDLFDMMVVKLYLEASPEVVSWADQVLNV